ncbi:kelch domain-containing protein 4 [Anthonomus grandis grandis]|uniref:kelch domain-containing protein 4 n=1 Tax=Anthonomus grandis grandis TaxID=2921223 RepID=UPI002166082C|nr:kelch domain-containing protein 4 [Anthonomus grandis grandis]
MGKKDKNKKKGKGAEKTQAKTEKKLCNKLKKELKDLGEDDIESIVAQIEKEEKKRSQVIELQVEPPSRRVNFTFVAHPDKDQLILYGGEYFNGQKTFVYNDLFFYNLTNNTWTLVKAPGGPPPRCGHQMVATSANKGQLWVFGGEFASPTQSQFYHYRDLWVYHISKKQWEKVAAPDGPSARSGHRMVLVKKQLFVFGGFHDNLRDYKYFNDVHVFDLETYKWKKLEPVGTPPAPRSGCCMTPLQDSKILVYGGYSKEKIKKDVDKGHVYTDAFVLGPDKHDPNKYKWQQVKIGGQHFSPRCSMPVVTTVNSSSAYCFGGVFDTEDDEEDISGNFFNDFYQLDLEKMVWREMQLTGKREKENKPRRRRKEDGEEDEENENGSQMDTEQPIVEPTIISDDGVFKVTIGPAATSSGDVGSKTEEEKLNLFQPSARMNCGLAIKHGILYLYGGMFEDGGRELTFSDLYSIDLKKVDEWKVIIEDDSSKMEWLGSDSESGSDEDDSDESEEDSDSEMDTD